MTVHPAFRGHGTFCYLAKETMDAYRDYRSPNGSPPGGGAIWKGADGFVRAAQDMGMSHVWVRLFGEEGRMDRPATATLLDGLRGVGIKVAGWGYCHQGANWETRGLNWAKEECDHHKLDAFIADVEPDRELKENASGETTKSKWTQKQLDSYIEGLVQIFGKENVGISTWPMLGFHDEPAAPSLTLMRGVASKVAMFAPQAYWMRYPDHRHYNETHFSPAKYPANNPESFVRLVIDDWRAKGFKTSLVVTGQAYWGENSPPQAVMEAKVGAFAAGFKEWGKIIGFNWWHARGPKAMSDRMVEAIIAGKLGDKPFASP